MAKTDHFFQGTRDDKEFVKINLPRITELENCEEME